ncbi:hypothetical protein Q4Q57_09875 [Shewanella sp. SP2S2-6]|uniref:hypothetical protein n=1 Tax=Shewanella sp. SP2S2-6 TaxID=3063540 RepID=UPI002891D1F1|nr:hypothetical protein [Shewanella sp. SP2S2-6]MDT3295449.1 hypothetical protein [Shewanella sp. SP2S2-6]
MTQNVSDRLILKTIYRMYLSEFKSFDKESRVNKIYVPIDCDRVAKELNMDNEIVFGRLYYHLEKKHGYKQTDGSSVNLFCLEIDGDRHVVHFPLLSAVLAEEEQSFLRFTIPIAISFIALGLSIFTLITK